MTLTDLRNAQNRLSTLIASMPASDALTLAAAHAEQARAAAPSYAGEQRAAAAAAEVRIAARRYSTGGDWRSAVRASLEHAQFAHALTPSYLQDAAPAALPVCRRQLAAAGDPEEREREQLAKDLARWAGHASELAARGGLLCDGIRCVAIPPASRSQLGRRGHAGVGAPATNHLTRLRPAPPCSLGTPCAAKDTTMTTIINLTPHPVTVGALTIAPTLPPARAGERVESADAIIANDGTTVPTSWVTYTRLDDLPDPEPDTYYIVSLVVAQAVAQAVVTCTTRKGRGVHLTGVPFSTVEEMDAAYALLASAGASCNDASAAEKATATAIRGAS